MSPGHNFLMFSWRDYDGGLGLLLTFEDHNAVHSHFNH